MKRKITYYFNQFSKNIQKTASDVEGEMQDDSEEQKGQTDPDRTQQPGGTLRSEFIGTTQNLLYALSNNICKTAFNRQSL